MTGAEGAGGYFGGKPKARQAVWDRLQAAGVARFPFPPHHRIPSFEGAEAAAERLFALPLFEHVHRMKVNPDAPQQRVRELALERGIELYLPTTRLSGGFKRLDPSRIPSQRFREAATIAHADEWSEPVAVRDLPAMDCIVVGSVAVTRRGDRCGKGEGYADLEYAILRELGHPPPPVLTTIHSLQLVDFFPTYEHDIPLSYIVTPEASLSITTPGMAPRGVDWTRIPPERLAEMPVLRELKALKKKRSKR